MAPIETGGKLSLTKHYNIENLASEISGLKPGMSLEEVTAALAAPHSELADDLFSYDEYGKLEDDVLTNACRTGLPEARLLVWTALLLADPRLQEIVTNEMTLPSGKLNPTRFSADEARKIVETQFTGASVSKAASNLLRWFETAGIATGERHGSSIVGLEALHATSFAVPEVLNLLRERLAGLGITPGGSPDSLVDLSLGLGVNHWLDLTRSEFRKAALGIPPPSPKTPRSALPVALQQLDTELRRRGQLILQGPPGTGKTYADRAYQDWFTAGLREESRLTGILATIPENETSPERVADEIQARGLAGVWEIVQFHPSYSYERFVRGLQSVAVPGGVAFVPVNRVLGVLAELGRVLLDRGDDCELLLTLDEINRADIPKVFGELLYSLEYRDEPVATPYSIDGDSTLAVPRNLLVLGTMNTADQSIALVDKALRRRFAWLTLVPDRAAISGSPLFAGSADREAAEWLFGVIASLFEPSDPELKRLQPGHSYFLLNEPVTDTEAGITQLSRRFAVEIWPLLEEYESEGLLDQGQLDSLLKAVGWKGAERPTDQDKLSSSVGAVLKAIPSGAGTESTPAAGTTPGEPAS